MKAVVIGATGRQGKGVIDYLLKQKDVTEVVACARRMDKVKGLIESLRDDRLQPKFIDVSERKNTVEALKGADVAINCAYEGYNTDEDYVNLELVTTQAALEAGVNYVGLGGAPPAPEQLALGNDFERKDILAILGMGILTGLLQIMAAYAINRLDRTDRVDMRYGERDLVPPEEHTQPLALGPKLGPKGEIELSYGFLNSTRFRYCVESVSYENRKLIYAASRGNPEPYIFRGPIGTLTVTQSPGSAVISLSRSFPEIKHITLKTAGNPDFDKNVGLLRDLGFFGNIPINVKGKMVSPWDVLIALIGKLPPETKAPDIRSEARVVVCGEEAGKEVEYSISWLRIGSSAAKVHIIASSGLCAAISAVMLGRRQTKGKGVLMPEVCIPPELFLNEFANAGMEIEIVKKMKV